MLLRHDDVVLRGGRGGRTAQMRFLEGRQAHLPPDIPRPACGQWKADQAEHQQPGLQQVPQDGGRGDHQHQYGEV